MENGSSPGRALPAEAMMSAKVTDREGVRLAALCPSWTLAQAVKYLGEEMGLENLSSVHSPCRKEGLY